MTEDVRDDAVTILIVDDRPENLLSMESLLQNKQCRVCKAASGQEALARCLHHDFALVLLDVQMPEMDGFETATLMRGHPKTRRLPIIFVTAGEKSPASLFKGYEAGAVDYIYKPIDPQILVSKVEVFCELYRQRRAIERHEQRLAEQVAERTRELRQALTLAEAASKVKSEFLGNVSHEIRTPVTTIQSAIELLHGTRLDAEQQQFFAMIETSAGNLLGLIENLLDLAELETDRLTIEQREFSPRDCLETVMTARLGQMRTKQLALRKQVDAAIPDRLHGDPARFRQIAAILLDNAIKFTASGFIALTLTLVDQAAEQVVLRLQVEDSGIGIDTETCKRLFLPFEQGDGSMTRRFGGAGLGLAICQRLVRLLGGEIDVTSQPGAGSLFSVRLPFTVT
ncbi:MAG: response regulator [Desulfuromonadales bacterium]|nr:response regulator [Desulfuromonadales bacterium]